MLQISIHLMLRFIGIAWVWVKCHIHFNTSHVTVYRSTSIQPVWIPAISIHLMLRFIPLSAIKAYELPEFQYISCYGLSLLRHPLPCSAYNFNTSHVTVYPYNVRVERIRRYISIHLMLRFIYAGGGEHSDYPIFQYISCYGLSESLVLKGTQRKIFQYISCYGLSFRLSCKAFLAWSFQYISCYGLSGWSAIVQGKELISIHLMLRFIQDGTLDMPYEEDFNTSHVTVYPIRSISLAVSIAISIHLMLRFIQMMNSRANTLLHISIHLMLRFI